MPGVAAILYLWRFQACCFLTSSAWVLLPTAKGSGFLGVKQVRDCWYYLIWWESKVTAPLSSPSPAHPAAGGQPWGVLPAVPLGNRVYVAWGRPAGACWDHQRVTEHLQGFLWVTYIRRTTPLITVTKPQDNAPPCYSQLPCEGSALGAYHSDFHSVLGYQQNQVNPEWFCFEYEHRKTIALIQLSSVNLPCEIQGNLQEVLGFPTMRDGSTFICMVTPPTYALCKIP